ncbi:MAG: Ni/Fe hydrogenase subunit alpha [Candidatus Hodarchaeales archaeon]|jgi:F420-non-reducing hydrogenase large subunit
MAKTLTIEPITRIEGHAKITIHLDDAGNVSDARFQATQVRGFERFCVGRKVEDMPKITPRICGVCPWAHHLASAKTCDAVFGVDIPETAKKLRELAYSSYLTGDLILQFYLLSGPDFVVGPTEDYTKRNVKGLIAAVPEYATEVVKIRYAAQMMSQTLSGKAIHPVAAVPGGWSKPLKEDERKDLVKIAEENLAFAQKSIAFVKGDVFPKYLDVVKTLGVIETGFLGTVRDDGALNHYDGKLRLMKADGSYTDFETKDYTNHISEHVDDWSHGKFPYYKNDDGFSMDTDNPKGIYRVGSLARINVCDKMATPLAQAELDEFRKLFGRPAQQPLLYHWGRLIETIYAAERTLELLNDPEITNEDTWKGVEPRAARGVGHVEASRGTLIHDYTTDEQGLLTDVNLIVATIHNQGAINMSVKTAAQQLIKEGNIDQGIMNQVELTVRCYDPCMSCATHAVDGVIATEIHVQDHKGEIVAKFKNFK